MTGRVHGLTAILLGAWETIAWTTRRVPTVSSLYARWRERQKRAALVSMLVWLASLGWHLGTYRERG